MKCCWFYNTFPLSLSFPSSVANAHDRFFIDAFLITLTRFSTPHEFVAQLQAVNRELNGTTTTTTTTRVVVALSAVDRVRAIAHAQYPCVCCLTPHRGRRQHCPLPSVVCGALLAAQLVPPAPQACSYGDIALVSLPSGGCRRGCSRFHAAAAGMHAIGALRIEFTNCNHGASSLTGWRHA